MEIDFKNAIKILTEKNVDIEKSMFGGCPFVDKGFEWPIHNGVPLNFLAQINLSELNSICSFDFLPQEGLLLFFYDNDRQPWGDFDDFGAWRVLYQKKPVIHVQCPYGIYEMGDLKNKGISFIKEETYQNPDLLFLNESVLTEYYEKYYSKNEGHIIGGYSYDIQSSSKEDAFMVQHRHYHNNNFNNIPADDFKKYTLLFQMDSDYNINFQIGDMGTLYFYGDMDEMKKGDFSNIWITSQCA